MEYSITQPTQPGHAQVKVPHSRLGGRRRATSTPAEARRGRDGPSPDDPDRKPLLLVVSHDYSYPVVSGHMVRELVAVGKSRGRAAPGDTKMPD